MSLEAYFTICVVVGTVIALVLNIAAADFLLFAALVVLMFSGIITPAEALSGFSNQGVIIVGLFFIVSRAMQNTGAINGIVKSFFNGKRTNGISSLMLRMMIPITCVSAFLNNTPIVVVFVPIVKKWAERYNLSASKFLIPLSYAAIFGGICTLIGTSTNLVVHGLMLENKMEGLSMFELAKVGIPCAIIGWIYLAFVGQRILPDNKDLLEVIEENKKEYVVEMRVKKGCELIGKTIIQASLRNLKGLFLVAIERDGKSFGPVPNTERIKAGDHLMFVGVTSAVVDLYDIHGLVPVTEQMAEEDFKTIRGNLVEAVVSSNSPVLGKTIKEYNFRERYGAGIIAVHRNGERILSKIGSIKLKAGDTFLLLAAKDFLRAWKNSGDFYLISNIKTVMPNVYHKARVALAIVALMILSVTFGPYLPKIGYQRITMLHAAFAAVFLLVLMRCVRINEARESIQWQVLITIACALGVSKAIENSGTSNAIAGCVIDSMQGFGVVGVLAAIYFLTIIFTELITNSAAAALVFPIALSAASQLGVNPKPFFITIAIAASASFLTPIGYQTNLIVQGAGGYKFTDYFKVGLPLSILFFITAIILIPIFWSF